MSWQKITSELSKVGIITESIKQSRRHWKLIVAKRFIQGKTQLESGRPGALLSQIATELSGQQRDQLQAQRCSLLQIHPLRQTDAIIADHQLHAPVRQIGERNADLTGAAIGE